MTERIESIRHDDGVVELHLVRTDKMNALDAHMFDALIAHGEQLRDDASVRAVVITGRGKAFCAGLDMASFAAMGEGGNMDLVPRTHGIANKPQYIATVWRDVPVPVIAAVHGVAFGGGLQLALGADLRLVTADTRMSVMEIKWGLVPDMGGLPLLRPLVRDDIARELAYTGRIVLGEEAVALGLATRVVADPLAEAQRLAHEIAARSPDAIRANKRLFNAMADVRVSDAQ
ncbi:MAG: crotonase/enoyl-CoA hydratase family protein, partial [Comamonadaceae bacterium]